MKLVVEVRFAGPDRPAAGTLFEVEVRDVGYADAPSVTLSRATGRVDDSDGDVLGTVEADRPDTASSSTVWAHVDTTGSGTVSRGDLVTTQSFPLPGPEVTRMPVTVDRIGPA